MLLVSIALLSPSSLLRALGIKSLAAAAACAAVVVAVTHNADGAGFVTLTCDSDAGSLHAVLC